MHVIDLVLQGVRRFGESRKFPVKPGFNVVFGPTETGKTTLVECLLDLLYPQAGLDSEVSFVSWGEPAASRAGLTLSAGRDIYRILKDYKTGKISLTQYNPASQKFEPVASDPVQAGAMMVSALELPPLDSFRYLFVAAARRMPSTLIAGAGDDPAQIATRMGVPAGMISAAAPPDKTSAPAIPGVMSMPGMPPGPAPMMGIPGMVPGQMMPGMMPMPGMPMAPGMMVPGMSMPGAAPTAPEDGMTPEEREQKLKQLRKELHDAEEVDKLQFELDGLQQKVFEIENKKKGTNQFDEWLDQAKAQLDRYPMFRRLPENIDSRLDNFQNIEAQRASEIEKFDHQALGYDEELREIESVPPLWNQLLFRVGAGLSVGGILVFFIAPMVGMEGLKNLGLLSIPGVFIAAYSIWQHISRVTRKGQLEKLLSDLEEKKQASMKRYEIEMAVIQKIMEETDSDGIEELKGKLQKFRALDENYRSRLDRKKKMLKEMDIERLEREEKELRAEIKRINDRLKEFPAFSMDVHSMRTEIKRLEPLVKSQNPESSSLSDTAGFGVPDLDAGPAPGATVIAATPPRRRPLGPTTATELYEALLQAAAKFFEMERNHLLASVQTRFNLYVQAFFAKRYSEARIDPDGSVALKQAEGVGRWLDFDQLSPAARDTCFVALQIALLEQATQKKLLPVFLDNPYAGLDEAAATLAAKAMKRLGERTQVILLTSSQAPVALADNSLSLV